MLTPFLEVVRPPAVCTVQDLGRPGWRTIGVPAGGAMDARSLAAANLALGNAPGAAALEWAEGGGTMRALADGWILLAGAVVEAWLDDAPATPGRPLRVRAGAELRVGRFLSGRFLYLAARGGFAVPEVLGSRSTYLPARLGGLEGRRLRAGDRLDVHPAPGEPPADATLAPPRWDDPAPLRLVPGPARDLVGDAAWRTLLDAEWRVSRLADRTGYRLEGPAIPLPRPLDHLPSAPTCPGALQLPASGHPIVLLADAPTIGGYPIPGALCTADLPRLAQRRPGEAVRFREVSVEEAVAALTEISA